jgi:BirA family biotin operon repressor/biotin-[acetyl-CoA-carboxylase] ligase
MPDPAANYRRVSDPGTTRRLASTRFTDVRWFAEIDSTNRYLLDEAAAGAPDGVVAVADVQTAGRGRLGRRWESPRGASLLVSVLLRPRVAAGHVPLLVSSAAIAAAEAVEALAGIDARVKWPNDLMVGDRKLAGILAEAIPGTAVVVGMGLNVQWDRVPPELDGIATACNLESAVTVERAALLVEWLVRFERWLEAVETAAGRSMVRDAVHARSATLGRRVRVELPDHHVVEGIATGLDDAGHLLVTDAAGSEVRVAAGDVVHVRDA